MEEVHIEENKPQIKPPPVPEDYVATAQKQVSTFRFRLHVLSKLPFFVPVKNGLNAVLWCCLHVTSKGSKVLVTKMVTLMIRANEYRSYLPLFGKTKSI